MTVKKADGQDGETPIWACQWFDRNGKLHADSFPEDMLDIFVTKTYGSFDS